MENFNIIPIIRTNYHSSVKSESSIAKEGGQEGEGGGACACAV